MIKRFKLFEKWSHEQYDLEEELVKFLDESVVEEYYEEHSGFDIQEAIYIWPDLVWNNIDDDKYVEEYIQDEINSLSIEDLSCDEDDYRKFLEENWSDSKEEKTVKNYKDKQYEDEYEDRISGIDGKVSLILNKETNEYEIKITNGNEIDDEEYTIPESHNIYVSNGDFVKKDTVISSLKYEEYMFEELDEDELRQMIEDENEADEFVEAEIRRRYEGEDARTIIEDIYGSKIEGKELYNMVQYYIDDDAIEKEYKEYEDYETKANFVKDYIYKEIDFQRTILKANKSNVLKLANLFVLAESEEHIADEYKFQKLYIREYVKENIDEDTKANLKALALKYLYDNFGIDDDIEKEYSKYTWLVLASKYNIG